jgi:hypothetical protein
MNRLLLSYISGHKKAQNLQKFDRPVTSYPPPATYLSRRSRIALRRIAPLRSKCSTLDLWTLDRLAITTKKLKIHENQTILLKDALKEPVICFCLDC